MTNLESFFLFFVIAVVALAFVFWKNVRSFIRNKKTAGAKNEEAADEITTDTSIRIIQKWKMPKELKEISGIAIMDMEHIACIQDEVGKIYIFNTVTNKIEKEIPFGILGDYEGIAIANGSAYIIRADGMLFEVTDYSSARPSVNEYRTHLTAKQDVEGLCYDQKKNRLLLSIKGKEEESDLYKGIYAFDLSSKKIEGTPVFKIDLSHDIWNQVKKKKNKIQPSDIEVHPVTGDVYILDGADPKLLVMDSNGTYKKLYKLGSDEFSQPEGISILPTGEVFISNEGKNSAGNILKLSLEQWNLAVVVYSTLAVAAKKHWKKWACAFSILQSHIKKAQPFQATLYYFFLIVNDVHLFYPSHCR